jgi:hypothetical protein
MTTIDEAIKHMVECFLAWKLPDDFNPDGGVAFTPTFNDHLPAPMRHEPTGTNLLTYTQAEAMVRHMLEGSPLLSSYDEMKGRIEEAERLIERASTAIATQRSSRAGIPLSMSSVGDALASFVSREKVDGGARG